MCGTLAIICFGGVYWSFFVHNLLFYLFAEIVSRLKVTQSRIKGEGVLGGYSHVKHYRFDIGTYIYFWGWKTTTQMNAILLKWNAVVLKYILHTKHPYKNMRKIQKCATKIHSYFIFMSVFACVHMFSCKQSDYFKVFVLVHWRGKQQQQCASHHPGFLLHLHRYLDGYEVSHFTGPC